MCATPLRSGFQGYCTFLNRCVGTCMRFSLLFEPLKIYHHIPADDLLQAAVNSVTLARENIFCTHSNFSTDCTCIGGLETEAIITRVTLRYVLVSRLLLKGCMCFIADLHCTLHAPA